jgi:hypothetical protein
MTEPPTSILRQILFSLAVALSICMLRIAIFDGPVFFAYRGIPNHDILSGITAFGSSMYELRTAGDIAWWLPSNIGGGDPGYYNFFLSPLAPTAGSPAFLLWGACIKLLAIFHVIIAEYRQFLVFNYILMPILAYSALFLLATRLCTNFSIQILIVFAYAFSGTGIWNNAWMYYQEWACIFLFFWSLDLFISKPTPLSFLALCISILNYAASASYWTLFSSWILLSALGLHVLYFRPHWRRVGPWMRAAVFSSRRLVIAGGLVVLSCGLWGATQATVYVEQSHNHMRSQDPNGFKNGFTLNDVYSRAQETDIRFFSIELFDPIVERPLNHYQVINPAHSARYIGISFLPLIVIFFLFPWQRRDHILFGLFLLTTSVCLTSGLFLLLWEITPGMTVQRHIFYFYQYFLQLTLIFMGCRALDQLVTLRGKWPKSARAVLIGASILGMVGFAFLFMTAESYGIPGSAYAVGPFQAPGTLQDPKLKSIGFAAFLLILSSAVIFRIGDVKRMFSRVYVIALLIVVGGDLMHFYWRASIADQQFTQYWRGIKLTNDKLPKPLIQALKAPWSADHQDDLYYNLPIANLALFPVNSFNPSANVRHFNELTPERQAELTPNGAICLASEIGPTSEGDAVACDTSASVLTSRYLDWDYNGETLEVSASRPGLAILRINYDSNWEITVDGSAVTTQLANVRMMAFKLDKGDHAIKLDYRPKSRILYHLAAPMTLITLFLLLYLCLWGEGRAGFKRRPAFEPGMSPII